MSEPLFVNIGNKLKGLFSGNSTTYTKPEEQQAAVYDARGVKFSDPEVDQLKRIIFSEVSNREPAKQELEARVLFNTAINRAKAYQDKGQQRSLTEVLTQPNQYQGYNSSLYKRYDAPGDAPTTQRKKQVEDITNKLIGEVQSGTFQDNTNGAYYYKHKGDRIYYDDSRPLFAK